MNATRITKMETKIDAKSALDMFGKSFRFDHDKGLAEWIKNSADAYLRDGAERKIRIPDSEQAVIIRFRNKSKTAPASFECIDFCGTTKRVIEEKFAFWFDKFAAKQDIKDKDLKTYGGHGNGGKFYMRQSFETSYFITYREGRLSMFGFDKDKDYGFVRGYEDVAVSPEKAFKIAGIEDLRDKFPDIVMTRFQAGDIRFSVVRGIRPEKMGPKKLVTLFSRLRSHPQSRNIIQTKQVFGIIDDGDLCRLEPEAIKPKSGFETPTVFEIPEIIVFGKENIEFANTNFPQGKLTLYTAEEPFNRYDVRSALNCINFKSNDIGIIASYRITELGGYLRNTEWTEFVYGDCECPILEDPGEDCVENDREHLVQTERVKALLWWITERVNDLTDKMVERSKEEQEQVDLQNTSIFNDMLNKWKNGFMPKFYDEIFGGPKPGEGPGVGPGDVGGGGGGEVGEGEGGTGAEGTGSGEKKIKASKYPNVLLSNSDNDPLNPGFTVNCDARHPLVYQRPQDVVHNIYWINIQSPLAHKIRDQYKTEHVRWREYMFERYVDIIMKQTVHELEKRGTQITADEVDNKFDEIGKRVYDSATKELEAFLFHEKYSGNK